ncbi:hypothetical protein N665_0064s0104 [Sinapis alba]|nr:hypothetical protein N665_0064s0104 [Sinapis alba]
MVRSCSSKSKSPWTEDENTTQKFAFASASKNGSTTPKKIGLRRCGKSCRVRKTENASGAKHESFTPEEEDLIIKMHAAMGSRWPLIAQHLPGKTEEEVKMVWNSKLKKKLSQMGIDHVTHRPFSHVLAEYGNINGGGGTLNPNPMNQTGSLGRTPSLEEDSHQQQKQPDDSGDLMFHLQAIKLMTESSNQVKPESTFMYASSSSSNSSPPLFSSTCSTIAQENSEVNFTWSDFLLDQETFNENQQNYPDQELDNLFGNEFSEAEGVATMANTATPASQMEEESLSNGFVESIIAKEKELFLGFPSYLEQPFHF